MARLGLRLTFTQPVPKTLGAVSITLWCLLRGVHPLATKAFYGSSLDRANSRIRQTVGRLLRSLTLQVIPQSAKAKAYLIRVE